MTSLLLLVPMIPVGVSVGVSTMLLVLRHRQCRARLTSEGFQELDILVKGRYVPDIVRVIRGIPVRLRFKREEDTQCSEQVIFSEFCGGVRLPAYQTTLVRFTPTRCGEFLFTCALGMYHGRLLVVPPSRHDLARIGGNRSNKPSRFVRADSIPKTSNVDEEGDGGCKRYR